MKATSSSSSLDAWRSRTWQPCRRAASWSRASASTVTASDVDAAHVAEGDVGAARLQQRADAVAEPGQVGAGDRTRRSRRRSCVGAEAAIDEQTGCRRETHRRADR